MYDFAPFRALNAPSYRRAGLIAILLIVCAWPAAVQADVIYLEDGSRVQGQVQSLKEGTLTIETDFAGTINIDGEQMTGLRSDRTLAVILKSGDRLVGVPRYSPEDGQRLTETAAGRVALEPAQIVAITDPDDPAPATEAARERMEQLKKEQQKQVEEVKADKQKQIDALKEEKAKYEDPWSLTLQLGLNGSTGNNERLSFDGRVDATQEFPDQRLNLFSEAHYARDDGSRSQNEVRGGANLEVDVSKKTFVFGKGTLEFDEFEDLDLRSTITAGLGYFFWEKEDHVFKGRLGAGYQHESFDDGTSADEGLLEVGYDYRYDFDEQLRFTHALTYYPTLSDPTSDYRISVETAGEVPIASSEQWKLRLGVRNEYDAAPQPGVERLDTFYFLNLAYDIE
jgi:putative salt-induced outer membrane protein